MQCDILEMVGVMRGKEIHRGRKKTTLKRMKSLLVPFIVLCCILTACSGKAPITMHRKMALQVFVTTSIRMAS